MTSITIFFVNYFVKENYKTKRKTLKNIFFSFLIECKPNQFQCRSGDCIDGSKRCNRVQDCPDGDDEDERCRKYLKYFFIVLLSRIL